MSKNLINNNHVSMSSAVKPLFATKPNVHINKCTEHKQEVSLYGKNKLLGVDKIKIRIPYLEPYKEYIDKFKVISEKVIDKEGCKYHSVMEFKKKHPYFNIILKTTFILQEGDKKKILNRLLYVEVNVPKFIYGNNVFESSYKDLEDVIQFAQKVLLDNNIIARKLNLKAVKLSCLEVGRNIIVLNAKEFIDLIEQNTSSWGQNEVKLTPYKTGTGYGFVIRNKHRQLSFYDKNLEIKESDPSNPIYNLLKENNIKIVRLEQKYDTPQEIRRVFKQDLSLYDLLYNKIVSSSFYDSWEKQKLHMNIYDLPKEKVKEVISYIKSDSKLGDKMKKGLVNFISNLANKVSFDTAYKILKKNFSINYRKKVIAKYEEIMGRFSISTFSFIDVINKNVYRETKILDDIANNRGV